MDMAVLYVIVDSVFDGLGKICILTGIIVFSCVKCSYLFRCWKGDLVNNSVIKKEIKIVLKRPVLVM